MPELPEVEHVVRHLAPDLVGRRVEGLVRLGRRWADPGVVRSGRPARLAARLRGRRIEAVRRRAKLVLLALEDEATVVVHLKLTGKLWLAPAARPRHRHDRLALALDDGRALWLEDQRRLAWVDLLTPAALAELEASLGPEPLEPGFTRAVLAARLARRRGRCVKTALLDPAVVAGVGNIYADEVLHRARLHPERRVASLGPAELRRLHAAIPAVLGAALARRRGAPDQQRVGAGGAAGRRAAARLGLSVYARAGEPCPRCGTPIARTVVGGRGTYACARCQPPPGSPGRR